MSGLGSVHSLGRACLCLQAGTSKAPVVPVAKGINRSFSRQVLAVFVHCRAGIGKYCLVSMLRSNSSLFFRSRFIFLLYVVNLKRETLRHSAMAVFYILNNVIIPAAQKGWTHARLWLQGAHCSSTHHLACNLHVGPGLNCMLWLCSD